MFYQTIPLLLSAPCPIYVGQHIFADHSLLHQHITGTQVLIVTQATIASHYLESLQQALQSFQCEVIFLAVGERHKNLAAWQQILDKLISGQYDRSATLLALGGGIVGDITGFAAACYLRGINYLQIATTLIAQVDSAIGGKTGVNHLHAKNMLGAFHQPQCVIADIAVLDTLPQRDYVAGLAEVIKYALIMDAEFFIWLESHMELLLLRDTQALLYAIHKSGQIKANIVMQDEKEQHLRSLLNLGHTFGHALEAACDYQNILHGEAVAIGIEIAVLLSRRCTGLTEMEAARILRLLKYLQPAQTLFEYPAPRQWLDWMRYDKKVLTGKIHLILLQQIGIAIKTAAVTEENILAGLEEFIDKKERTLSSLFETDKA